MRNIIKQILKEEVDLRSERVKFIVNKYGIGQAIELVVGGVDTIRNVYQSNPSEFLNQFNDLTQIEKGDYRIYYVEKNNIIYYVDKNGLPLFYYYTDEKNGIIYINYDRIWMFFSKVIGLGYVEIKGILKNWLKETYNITGFTPEWIERVKIDWNRPII